VRLSYSKLNTYRQCPLRYRFTYLERLPRRPRRLFRGARRIHHALMRWLTYARSGTPVWADVVAAYDRAWSAAPEAFGGPPEQSSDYQEGLEILRRFHEANLDRPCRPVHLEHRFAVPLGSHLLEGTIDRVDATETGFEVIDYKLDRELRSQAEVDSDLQLGLYQVGLERGQGICPDALTLYFLRHNLARTSVRSAAESAELAQWARATGDDIERESAWLPCAGEHCRGCDFRARCPAHTGEELPPPLIRAAAGVQLPILFGEPAPPAGDRRGQLALPL